MRFTILNLDKVKSTGKRTNILSFVNVYDNVDKPVMVKNNGENLGYVEDFVIDGTILCAEIIMFEDLGPDRVLRAEFREDGTLDIRTSDMEY